MADNSGEHIEPSPDFDEFVLGTGELDVASIGGYPVRMIEVVSGSGSLKVKTRLSDETYRTASALIPGSILGPLQIKKIGGTSAGSSALTLRVYK